MFCSYHSLRRALQTLPGTERVERINFELCRESFPDELYGPTAQKAGSKVRRVGCPVTKRERRSEGGGDVHQRRAQRGQACQCLRMGRHVAVLVLSRTSHECGVLGG